MCRLNFGSVNGWSEAAMVESTSLRSVVPSLNVGGVV